MSATHAKSVFSVLRTAVTKFAKNQCPQMAAAIAYYMIFSLPALLLIAVTIASSIARVSDLGSKDEVQEQFVSEVTGVVGPASAEQISDLLERSPKLPLSPLSIAAAAGMILLSASGVMMQVQRSLNTIWSVDPDSPRVRNRNFLVKRLLSLLSVLAIGLLLLLSVLISALLATLGDMIDPVVPLAGNLKSGWALSTATDLVVGLLLFTAVYKWLPDTRVTWKYAWLGGAITAVLFIIGKSLLAMFLAHVEIGSAYGAAGSLAMLLAWFYYSALVFLFGAELTRAIEASTMRSPAATP